LGRWENYVSAPKIGVRFSKLSMVRRIEHGLMFGLNHRTERTRVMYELEITFRILSNNAFTPALDRSRRGNIERNYLPANGTTYSDILLNFMLAYEVADNVVSVCEQIAHVTFAFLEMQHAAQH
jgi:hypothetical protein